MSEVRGIFNLRGDERQNFDDSIDDNANGNLAALRVGSDHDDATAIGIFLRRHTELRTQINDWNHLAAKIDDAFHEGGGLRDTGDLPAAS